MSLTMEEDPMLNTLSSLLKVEKKKNPNEKPIKPLTPKQNKQKKASF